MLLKYYTLIFCVTLTYELPSRCWDGALYWQQNQRCYSPNTRGPCSEGQKLVGIDGVVQCVTKAPSSSSIVFQSRPTCQGYTVWWPSTKTCEILLQRGPCKEGEWLVLTDVLHRPKGSCIKNPCPIGYALWARTNTCYEMDKINGTGICPEGYNLYYTPQGTGACNCKPGYFVFGSEQRCYPGYRQGPCPPQFMLIYHNHTSRASCVRNFCEEDGLVSWSDGECYRLNTIGPCLVDELYKVNPRTGYIDCVREGTRHIITGPVLASLCNPGTFLTGAGICKAAVSVTAATLFKLFG